MFAHLAYLDDGSAWSFFITSRTNARTHVIPTSFRWNFTPRNFLAEIDDDVAANGTAMDWSKVVADTRFLTS